MILREIFSFFLHDKSGRKIAIELSVVTLCSGASSNLVYARPSPVSFSLSCILRLSRTTFFIWRRLFPRLHVFQQFQNRFPPDFYAPSCRHLSLISWRKKKKKKRNVRISLSIKFHDQRKRTDGWKWLDFNRGFFSSRSLHHLVCLLPRYANGNRVYIGIRESEHTRDPLANEKATRFDDSYESSSSRLY